MYHLYSERNLGPWDWDPYWPQEIRKWPPNELAIMIQIDEWLNERTHEELEKRKDKSAVKPHG
jgi:hypothetical protein